MPEECKAELKALKPSTHSLLVADCPNRIGNCMICKDYHSMLHLRRVTAYVLQAVQTFKTLKEQPRAKGHQVALTAEDLSNAEKMWIAEAQFSLIKDQNFDQWKKQLDLFRDKAGLWRCGEG